VQHFTGYPGHPDKSGHSKEMKENGKMDRDERASPKKGQRIFAIMLGVATLMSGTGMAQEIPDAVQKAFRGVNPLIGNIELAAYAKEGDATYYGLWGPLKAKGDSDFTEQATFKWENGQVTRVDNKYPVMPAERYLGDKNPAAQTLDQDFVRRRIQNLGGKEAAEAFLWGRGFMTKTEALTWFRAGVRLNPDLKLYDETLAPPFTEASELIPPQGLKRMPVAQEKPERPSQNPQKLSQTPERGAKAPKEKPTPKPTSVEW
jgi:hypothetical protein